MVIATSLELGRGSNYTCDNIWNMVCLQSDCLRGHRRYITDYHHYNREKYIGLPITQQFQ
jgi:hypothetical protein